MLLRLDLQNRVKAEGIAIFAKSVSLYLFLTLDIGLLAFALAQIVYCMVLISMYSYLFRNENILKELFAVVQIQDDGSKVLLEHKIDLKEFSLVCIVKFVLTEGEKFIIFAFRDFVSSSFFCKLLIGLECAGRIWSHLKPHIDSVQICLSAY